MLKKILFVVSALALARAQVPSLGWCPEYVPMANFDMSKFLGVWYEAERYFQITEVVSRCVMANYTQSPDGKLRVSNEVTNRFTGIKRILEGEIKPSSGSKADEGKLHVKYTVPFTPETKYAVLDTDYKNYAVMWSCSGIGPINAQNAWLMTRARQPAGDIMQKAYGVLDKYKISKAFFVKTDQADCAYLSKPEPAKPAPAKPAESAESTEKPVVEVATEEEAVEEAQQAKNIGFRSAIIPDAPAIIADTRDAEIAESAEKPALEAAVAAEPEIQSEVQPQADSQPEAIPEIPKAEPVEAAEEAKEQLNVVKEAVKAEIPAPVSVPEVILKTADRVKELEKEPAQDAKQFQPLEIIKEVLANPAAQFQESFSNNVAQFQEAIKNPVQSIQEAIAGQAAQFQDAISKPLAQLQETFATPLQNIQQVFNRPAENIPAVDAAPEKNPETVEKPAEAVKETLNLRAVEPEEEVAAEPAPEAAVEEAAPEPASDAVLAEVSPVKLSEEIKEKEAAPKEEEEKKIVS